VFTQCGRVPLVFDSRSIGRSGRGTAPSDGSNNGPICAGETLQLNASTVANAAYSWTGPNAFASAEQNPQILSAPASASGTYAVRVMVNGCVSPAAATSVLVRALPSAAVSAGSSVCPNSPGNSASVPSAGAGANYTWQITNGTIAYGAGTASITFTAGGSGSVDLSVTVTDSHGCGATGTKVRGDRRGPGLRQRFLYGAPCRVADTREAPGPSGGPELEAGTVRTFPVANTCGIPLRPGPLQSISPSFCRQATRSPGLPGRASRSPRQFHQLPAGDRPRKQRDRRAWAAGEISVQCDIALGRHALLSGCLRVLRVNGTRRRALASFVVALAIPAVIRGSAVPAPTFLSAPEPATSH